MEIKHKWIPTQGVELEAARNTFVEFVTTQQITAENLIKAWQLFQRAQYYGEIEGIKRFPGG